MDQVLVYVSGSVWLVDRACVRVDVRARVIPVDRVLYLPDCLVEGGGGAVDPLIRFPSRCPYLHFRCPLP